MAASKKNHTSKKVLEGTVEVSDAANVTAENDEPELIATPSTNDIVVLDTQANALGPLIGGITTAQLQQALQVQTEQRALIKQFIQDHLVDGTDFGRIHVVNKDKCRDLSNYKPCNFDGHYSKRVLFKPGQEKLFSLFQITDRLERDEETYQMLSNVGGLVAFKCTLYRNGQEIGHGRGSAVVGDNRRDANATVKIAEKRARMDACLSLGFSEYFAQDLDDPDYKAQAEMAERKAAMDAERHEQEELSKPVSSDTRTTLARWMHHRGFKDADKMLEVAKLNGVRDPSNMTEGAAKELIQKLSTNVFEAPPAVDMDDPANWQGPAAGDDPTAHPTDEPASSPPPQPSVKEAELVVDDEFRSQLYDQYKNCGLNHQGDLWFQKYITGRPFKSWDDFTEDEWRRAYQLVADMQSGAITVDERHIVGLIP